MRNMLDCRRRSRGGGRDRGWRLFRHPGACRRPDAGRRGGRARTRPPCSPSSRPTMCWATPRRRSHLIEYASFTCPHCAHFHTQILPEIKKKWIDTGKVKLIYRDFPLDQVAAKAAQIAECAGNDRYFGVIDLIFRGQPQWATAAGSDRRARQAAAHRRPGRERDQGLPRQRGQGQRGDRRLSRRRDARRQLDAVIVHQRASL